MPNEIPTRPQPTGIAHRSVAAAGLTGESGPDLRRYLIEGRGQSVHLRKFPDEFGSISCDQVLAHFGQVIEMRDRAAAENQTEFFCSRRPDAQVVLHAPHLCRVHPFGEKECRQIKLDRVDGGQPERSERQRLALQALLAEDIGRALIMRRKGEQIIRCRESAGVGNVQSSLLRLPFRPSPAGGLSLLLGAEPSLASGGADHGSRIVLLTRDMVDVFAPVIDVALDVATGPVRKMQ